MAEKRVSLAEKIGEWLKSELVWLKSWRMAEKCISLAEKIGEWLKSELVWLKKLENG